MSMKMHIFQEFLIDHEDFVSFVLFYAEKLSLKFLQENIYLPSMRVLVQEIPVQKCF